MDPDDQIRARFYINAFVVASLLLLLAVCAASAETASWYSSQSCQKEGTSGVWTASGERFSDGALTAAMWGVKFGTLVRVTNLANGRSVVVQINDRGPAKRLAARGRIIDLAQGAFARIAKLDQGVVKVRAQILEDGEAALVDGKGKYWYESEDGRSYYDNKGNHLYRTTEEA